MCLYEMGYEILCACTIGVILDKKNGDPQNFSNECYSVNTYMKCYENIINPINEIKIMFSQSNRQNDLCLKGEENRRTDEEKKKKLL